MALGLVVIGIILEISATVLGTFGKQLVSYSARLESRRRASYTKVVGLVITSLFGPLFDAAAYAFAPQSLIAPLNGLDLVWNTCSAPFTLGESLTNSHIIGTAFVLLGLTLSAFFGPHEEAEPTLQVLYEHFSSFIFLTYGVVALVALTVSAIILRMRPRGNRDWIRGTCLAMTAGSLAGNMFFLSQALGLLRTSFSSGDWSPWQHWLPYGVFLLAAVVAISNIPFMALALEEYDALFVIPVFAGSQIIISCISATTVLGELHFTSWTDILIYWCAVGLVLLGLLIIMLKAKQMSSYQRGVNWQSTLLKMSSVSSELGDSVPELGDSVPTEQTGSRVIVWASAFSGIGCSTPPGGSSFTREATGSSTGLHRNSCASSA